MRTPKVGFLVIGAQKAGTTALDHHLRQHPQIGMARVKEVHYFDNEDAFAHEEVDHAAYEREFDLLPGRVIHGESTPIYLYWEAACQRIHRYNPEMKLIAILRHPMERAISHWNMEFNRGAEERDLLAAVREEHGLIQSGQQQQDRVRSYLHRGFYSTQIARFQRFFRPDQMLLLRHDTFREEPQAVLSNIFRFLGLDEGPFTFAPVELNRGNASFSMPAAEFDLINRIFHEDIHALEALTGWDLSAWMRPPGGVDG